MFIGVYRVADSSIPEKRVKTLSANTDAGKFAKHKIEVAANTSGHDCIL